jgi:hypothetical protein
MNPLAQQLFGDLRPQCSLEGLLFYHTPSDEARD